MLHKNQKTKFSHIILIFLQKMGTDILRKLKNIIKSWFIALNKVLMLRMQDKKITADDNLKFFFFTFFPGNRLWQFMQTRRVPMNCQILFSGEKKYINNLSSAKFAQWVVKAYLNFFLILYKNICCCTHQKQIAKALPMSLCSGFKAQSTQWGHVERIQFTYLTTRLLGRLSPLSG